MNSLIGLPVHSDNHKLTAMNPATLNRGESLRPSSGSSIPDNGTPIGNALIALPIGNAPKGTMTSQPTKGKTRLSKQKRDQKKRAEAAKAEADIKAEAAKAAPKPSAAKSKLIPVFGKLCSEVMQNLESAANNKLKDLLKRGDPVDKYLQYIRNKRQIDISTVSLVDLTEHYDDCIESINCEYLQLMLFVTSFKISINKMIKIDVVKLGEKEVIKAVGAYFKANESLTTRIANETWTTTDDLVTDIYEDMQSNLKRLNSMLKRNRALASRETELKIPNLLVLKDGEYQLNMETDVAQAVFKYKRIGHAVVTA